MTTGSLFERGWARWLLGLAFWTALGLSFASQFYLSSAKAGLEVTWRHAVSVSLGDWYVVAALSVPVIYLSRRFPFEAGIRELSVGVHALASVLFSVAYMLLRALLGSWQTGVSFEEEFNPLLVKTWHFNLLIYWVILAVTMAFDYYAKFRERELRAAELEKRLAEAKLQALQMQLNPHFLFNTLHSISSLMHQNVEAADRMIMRLSDLLRAALDRSDEQEVSLKRELELLELYLTIEQIRFGERLKVKMDIAPETLDAQVPNLILQPLVENAIKHGIEPHARPGCIELRAHRRDSQLALEVCDDGKGMPSKTPAREGVGLSNTRARLRELYGDGHQFELNPGPDGGLHVNLVIPFHTATA